MERRPGLISVFDFRQLLSDLKDKRPDIGVRYRMLGDMWATSFMSVLYVNDKSLLLNDVVKRKIITVPDLANIMQFELDSPFQGYQPYYHYEVHPLLDTSLVPYEHL